VRHGTPHYCHSTIPDQRNVWNLFTLLWGTSSIAIVNTYILTHRKTLNAVVCEPQTTVMHLSPNAIGMTDIETVGLNPRNNNAKTCCEMFNVSTHGISYLAPHE